MLAWIFRHITGSKAGRGVLISLGCKRLKILNYVNMALDVYLRQIVCVCDGNCFIANYIERGKLYEAKLSRFYGLIVSTASQVRGSVFALIKVTQTLATHCKKD